MNGSKPSSSTSSYQALVNKIADRVWELWKRDLRRARERQGRLKQKR